MKSGAEWVEQTSDGENSLWIGRDITTLLVSLEVPCKQIEKTMASIHCMYKNSIAMCCCYKITTDSKSSNTSGFEVSLKYSVHNKNVIQWYITTLSHNNIIITVVNGCSAVEGCTLTCSMLLGILATLWYKLLNHYKMTTIAGIMHVQSYWHLMLGLQPNSDTRTTCDTFPAVRLLINKGYSAYVVVGDGTGLKMCGNTNRQL